MNVIRKVLILFLALIFCFAMAVWIVYVPERPLAIYKAIPSGADLVSVHTDLADRLPGLMENRIVSRVMAATGLSREQMQSVLNDDDSRLWLNRVGSDRVVFAHLPNQGFAGVSAWCMAAWIGSESFRLRWSIGMSAPKSARAGSVIGTNIWRFELPGLPSGQRLYCAVEEGVLLAAISATPETIHRMVLTYQGREPSLMESPVNFMPPSDRDLTQFPDQFWFHTGWDEAPLIHACFGEISQLRLRGVLGFGSMSELAGKLGDTPQINWRKPIMQASLGTQTLRSLAKEFANNPVGMAALPLIGQVQSGPFFAGLFGEEDQGRLKGFRIPGLLLGFPVSDEKLALKLMLERLDRINATYSLGVIYSRRQLADVEIYQIAGTRDDFYGKLPVDEQIAFMLRKNFLLVGSHPSLLERIATDQFVESGQSLWDGMLSNDQYDYLWVDFDRSAKATRLALALYSLKLIDQDPGDARTIRKQIELARDWIEALVPYREGVIWRPASEDSKTLRFDLGVE